MININLIPEQLRKKSKGALFSTEAFNIPREALIGLIGGLAVILICVHAILQVTIFIKFFQHAQQKKQWDAISPQKQRVDVVLNELRSLQNKIKAVEQITTGGRISWAEKLNDISDSLPKGIWLTKLSLGEKILLIDGCVVSRDKGEISSVGHFVSELKKRKGFMQGVQNKHIEVGSIQKRKIQTVELADFLITVKLQ